MMKKILLLGMLSLSSLAWSQSYNAGACELNVAVPDNNPSGVLIPITVSGAVGNVMGTDVYLEQVNVYVTHTWCSDLDLILVNNDTVAPVTVDLSIGNGGSGRQYGSGCASVTSFTMSATNSITTGTGNFLGTFLPEGDFADFNNGSNPNGTWYLFAADFVGSDVGEVEWVELVFAVPPTCPAPSGLSDSAITASTATIGWTENGSATSWNVEYGPSGFTPGTGTSVVTGANPYTIAGLTASTSYDVYVKAICGVGDSSAILGPLTFGTECSPFVATYTQNFDANAAQNPFGGVLCWRTTGPGANDVYTVTATDDGATIPSGPNVVELNDGNLGAGDSALLVSPAFSDLGSGLNQIRFMAHQEAGGGGDLLVGVMSDPDDAGTFTLIQTITSAELNAVAGFQEYVVLMNNTTSIGSSQHIAFLHGSNAFELYIDNFVYEPMPVCVQPSALSASSITDVSADLSWTENGSATSWRVEYGMSGFTAGTGTSIVVSSNPYAVSGLSANTSYDFYVEAICGVGDTSSLSGPYAFTTECATYTATYTENFDANAAQAPFGGVDCWRTSGPGAVDIITVTATDDAVTIPSAPNAVELNDGNLGTGDSALLVTPAFSDLATGLNQIRFMAHQENGGAGDLLVGVMSDPDDAGTFTLIATITAAELNAIAGFQEYIVLMNNTGLIGSSQHIAFLHGVSAFELYIDDFVYEPMPSCPQPTALSVSNETFSSIDVAWTENGSATNWRIEYGPAGFTPGTGTIVTTATNPATLTGLTSGTDYDFYVQSVCGAGDTSIWAGPAVFTTAPDFCGGDMFYDNGGSAGNYTNFAFDETVICPTNAGDVVTVVFNSFSTEAGYDTLFVLNGDGLSAPLLGYLNGDTTGTFSSTDPSGCLTFVFVSDNTVTGAGWEASVSCGPACTTPTNVTAINTSTTSVDISWTDNGASTSWEITYGMAGTAISAGTTVTATTNPHSISGLTEGQEYWFLIRSLCPGGASSEWSDSTSFTVVEGIATGFGDRLTFYPNPASDQLFVKTIGLSQSVSIAVVNTAGQTVQHFSVTPNTTAGIDVSDLSTGLYTLRLTSGDKIEYRKLVIE